MAKYNKIPEPAGMDTLSALLVVLTDPDRYEERKNYLEGLRDEINEAIDKRGIVGDIETLHAQAATLKSEAAQIRAAAEMDAREVREAAKAYATEAKEKADADAAKTRASAQKYLEDARTRAAALEQQVRENEERAVKLDEQMEVTRQAEEAALAAREDAERKLSILQTAQQALGS